MSSSSSPIPSPANASEGLRSSGSSTGYTSLKSISNIRSSAHEEKAEKSAESPPIPNLLTSSVTNSSSIPSARTDLPSPKPRPIFDAIVITAASPLQSRAYTLELEMRKRLGFLPASTLVLSVPDPAGVRVGSGGATLNALVVVSQRLCINAGYPDVNYRYLRNKRILILHSGGDSQRIPIFSVRGKAFSTLPSVHEASSHLMAPVDFLIRQMTSLCEMAPEGGCVVLATDVLLLFPSAFKWRADAGDGVTGIGIVTEASLGPNHGVFVPAAGPDGAANFQEEELVQADVSDIIQKASLAQLTSAGAVRMDALGGGRVLLDSGIIYLSARVTMDFLRLHESAPFDACTDAGLDSGSHPFRFELYTDVLHAMNPRLSRADYFASPPPSRDSDAHALNKGRALLWKTLHPYKFFVSSSPQSHFAHLGTIEEYLTYLTTRTLFTAPFALTSRARFFTSYPSLVASSAILINSLLLGHGSVDDRALIENSILRGSFQVGARSVVSGVRSLSGIKVPNDSVIMEVQLSEERIKSDPRVRHILQQTHSTSTEAQWSAVSPLLPAGALATGGSPSIRVIVVLGLHDQIKDHYRKSSSSFVNRPWSSFFSSHPLAPTIDEVWGASVPDAARTLWNARVFPIFVSDVSSASEEHESSLWLQFADTPSVQVLHRWKHATRVSLEDILSLADCEAEFYWRTRASFLVDMKDIEAVLLEKQQRSILPIISRCDPHYKHHLLAYLDSVAASSYHSPAICSRALCSIADVLASYLPSVSKFQRSGPSRNPQWRKALQMLEDARNSEEHANAIRELSFIRNEWLSSAGGRGGVSDGASGMWLSSFATPAEIMRAARHFDGAWQALCRKGVQSLRTVAESTTFAAVAPPEPLAWVDVDMPVRFDLMGGWSDTPPITQETVGRVVNVAVRINGEKPIGSSARSFPLNGSSDFLVLRLGKQKSHPAPMAHLQRSDEKDGGAAEDEVVIIRKLEDVFDHANPIAPAALMKCCLVVLGVVDIRSKVSLADQLATALGTADLGLEVRAYSTLPQGTGLGVSSILAASIVAAIAPFVGRVYSKHALLHLVLLVEQALTTGGGWQDQAGGIYGGFKITESSGCLPLRVSTTVIPCASSFVPLFSDHVLLIHTGQSRLAKNLLQTVLRSWYHSDSAIVDTVSGLVGDALKMKAAIESSDIVSVGHLLSQFWHYKKTMASPTRSDAPESFHEAPVEPNHIARLIRSLEHLVHGLALVGAGGGGFLLLVTKQPLSEARPLVEEAVKLLNDQAKARAWAEEAIGEWPSDDYKIYTAKVDEEGMVTSPSIYQPHEK